MAVIDTGIEDTDLRTPLPLMPLHWRRSTPVMVAKLAVDTSIRGDP